MAAKLGGGSALEAALRAGLSTLSNKAAVAVVNNQGDLIAALEELGSSASLRSLITAMVSVGLAPNVLGVAGLDGQLPVGASLIDRTIHKLQVDLINASVNATVDVAINGGDFVDSDSLFSGWSTAMVMVGLGAIQERIGDFGEAQGLSEGDIKKVLAHAVAGGIAQELKGGEFADGALAGALSEILSGPIGEGGLNEARQIELQRLVTTITVVIASGGDAEGASFAGGIGASAHENNYLNHDEAVERARALQELEECEAKPGSCSENHMSKLQGTVALLDSVDATRDLELQIACANSGQIYCASLLRRYRIAAKTYREAPENYEGQEYLEKFGDIVPDLLAEFLSGEFAYTVARDASLEKGFNHTQRVLSAFGIGAASGASLATIKFGGAALAKCFANPVCRNEASVAIAEIAAGDALGGATLVPVTVVGGRVALTHGNKLVGFVNESGNFIRNDGPYDSKAMREMIEHLWGPDGVVSTTVPPSFAPNYKLRNQERITKSDHKVVFDDRGFPIFDPYVKFDMRFRAADYLLMPRKKHAGAAAMVLKRALALNPSLRIKFTSDQLNAIEQELPTIPDLVWHHHQDTGRMQLMSREVHMETGHIGGGAMREGR